MLPYNISDSTLWIVGAFLLITLIIGLYAGRGIKDIKDYALGNGRFGTFTITLSLVATYIGGGHLIWFSNRIFSFGIIPLFACAGFLIELLVIALIIAPKAINFKNCFTIGDIMADLYGEKFKIVTGIITLFFAIFKTSSQLMCAGGILKLIGVKFEIGIIVSATILGVYSAIGGIRSVSFTDVFQFLVLIIALPILGSIILKYVGGYKSLFFNLPSEKLKIFDHENFYTYLTFFFIWSFFPTTLTNPAIVQRILMINSKSDARNIFLTSTAIVFMFRIVVTIIALSSIVLFPNINSKEIFPNIINNLLSNNILKGIVISGILAILISSADSYIHSIGIVFSNDIFKPIMNNQKIKFNELFIARIATIFLTFLSIIIALRETFMSSKILVNNWNEIYVWCMKITNPVLLFPLLIGILGIKTDKRSAKYGMFIGIISIVVTYKLLPSSLNLLSIPISIIANGIAYMTSHILQNKGIAWVKRDKDKKEEKLWIPNPQKIINTIINSIPTPKKIFQYSRYQVMKNGSENMIFGIYCCINFTLPYFLWDHQDQDKFNLMTNLRFIGGMMAGLLIVKDQWKEFLKPYFPLYWHITLTYCLPFITTVMFLLTGGSLSWLMNIGTSIFFLIMLVTGEVFIILAPLGLGLGIIFYSYFVGPISMSALGFDINYFLFYQVFFSTMIGLLFAYRKQVSNAKQGTIGLNLGESLCHELRNTLYSLSCNQYNRMRIDPIIKQGTENIKGQESYVLSKKLFESLLDQTNEAINFDEDTLKVIKTFETLFKDYKKSLANPEIHSMKSIVKYTIDELHFLPGQKERIEVNLTDDFYVKVPKEPFAFVLSNLIRNCFKHGGSRELKIKIKLENHKLIISDNGKGIPSSDLERVFKMHYTTGEEGESTGIGLGFCKIIVNSFYGEIWCESEEGENSYTEFHIKFPEVNPSEIKEEGKNQ